MLCPLCRKPTTMPREERVGGLAANVTVNALVDDLKQSRSITLGLQKMTVSSKEPEDSLTVLKMLELPGEVRGMARLSDDTVVIGYGSSKSGADAVSISGAKKQYLNENIGPVYDIAILSDGRPVVSHGTAVIRVYNQQSFLTDIQFYTKKECADYHICIGGTDNVYAANNLNSIFIFQQGKETPHEVVPLDRQYAIQVGVTTTGMMIIRNQHAITLYDRYGNKGDTITASENHEFLHAAVDSQDRVFVGQIFLYTGRFKLSIYKIEDQRFIVLKKFKEVQLVIPDWRWHSMVCLRNQLSLH